MTKKERRNVTAIIVIALAIIAMIFGYNATKNKAAEVKTVKTTVAADVNVVKKAQETPAASTVVAKRTKAAAATTPVVTNTDNIVFDATTLYTAEEIGEMTVVTNEGPEADNLDADDVVAPGYNTPDEKEAEREAEKAEIEAEKEAEVSVKDDEVVEVPEIEDDVVIEDLVDENGDVVDDTDVAVEDYTPAVDSAICDCDSDDHNHVVTTEGGFTYIFCDHVEEIKVIDGVKYMPWIYFGFENEAAYVAATTPVEEVEVVEVVEVEAEEVEEETTEAIETEEVEVAEEIVEETVEEVVEAEEVEEETTVSGNEI